MSMPCYGLPGTGCHLDQWCCHGASSALIILGRTADGALVSRGVLDQCPRRVLVSVRLAYHGCQTVAVVRHHESAAGARIARNNG